jgi:hypothetical protein
MVITSMPRRFTVAKKTLTERVTVLEAALEEREKKIDSLEKRVAVLEGERESFDEFIDVFKPLLAPGTTVGDLVAQCLANPENVDDIVGEALSAAFDGLADAVEQNIHAVAEGHGINPKPKPSLYAAMMKGFNQLNSNKKKEVANG